MARLPIPGSDAGSWGQVLNDFLSQSHQADGSLKPEAVSPGLFGGSPSPGQVLGYDGSDFAWVAPTSGGSGEANTGSNVGTGGIGVYKQKTGTVLEFNTVAAASNKVNVSANSAVSQVDIDIVEANFSNIPQAAISGLTASLAAKVDSSDSRLSDARAPTVHASAHASAGSDPISPASIGASDTGHTHSAVVPSTTIISDYTIGLTDAGTVLEMNSALAVNVTIPTDATVAFPVGSVLEVFQLGVGTVTIAPAGGVTARTASSLVARGQYSTIGLRKRAANDWVVTGDLV